MSDGGSDIRVQRANLIRQAEAVAAQRIQIMSNLKSLRRAHSGRIGEAYEKAENRKAAALLRQEQDLRHKASTLRSEQDRTIGRKYLFLCKAIEKELGGDTLRSLIADAALMIEADSDASAAEDFE